ncbi:Protein ECERIFERUM 1 [Glycine soja]
MMFHSLHHTQFRTNYCLFMPFYDYIYGTMDKASDQLHDSAIKQEEEIPDVVHLAHLTTPEWWLCLMRPVTAWSMILTWVYGQTFIVEGNRFDKLKLQTRAIPKYSFQYHLQSQKMTVNKIIEEERSLTYVYGGIYITRLPKLKVRLVDGSNLAAAIVLNSIPKGTTHVTTIHNKDDYIWLVGDELTEEEQLKVPKGPFFIPFSQFPPRKYRKDCSYQYTPAMLVPSILKNVHSCEIKFGFQHFNMGFNHLLCQSKSLLIVNK